MTRPCVDPLSPATLQACRDDLALQLRTYRDLIAAASKASGASLTRIDGAFAAFEPVYFNNLAIALDARFAGRRDDAGPLAELRLLRDSLLEHGGVMAGAPARGHDPSASVLGLDVGDRIALNADDFEALAAAVLAALERAQAPA
jgi:hypothetical protein